MAGKGNVANLTPWQPGQSGNPNGRPRKLLRKLCNELDIDLGEAITVADKLEFINRMLDMPVHQLDNLRSDSRSPSWLVMVAGAIKHDIADGSMKVLTEVMDRVIGRPLQALRFDQEGGTETDKKALDEWTDYEIIQEEERLLQSLSLNGGTDG